MVKKKAGARLYSATSIKERVKNLQEKKRGCCRILFLALTPLTTPFGVPKDVLKQGRINVPWNGLKSDTYF